MNPVLRILSSSLDVYCFSPIFFLLLNRSGLRIPFKHVHGDSRINPGHVICEPCKHIEVLREESHQLHFFLSPQKGSDLQYSSIKIQAMSSTGEGLPSLNSSWVSRNPMDKLSPKISSWWTSGSKLEIEFDCFSIPLLLETLGTYHLMVVETTASNAFRRGLPTILLYTKSIFWTTNLVIYITVLGFVPTITGKLNIPIVGVVCSVKPTIGHKHDSS